MLRLLKDFKLTKQNLTHALHKNLLSKKPPVLKAQNRDLKNHTKQNLIPIHIPKNQEHEGTHVMTHSPRRITLVNLTHPNANL